jgi:hypothetical protein
MFKLKKNKFFHKKNIYFMSLCFLLCFLLFGWRKNIVVKYSPGYARGRFVGFLEI